MLCVVLLCYLCMYVYMYINVYLYIYICVCVCVCVHISYLIIHELQFNTVVISCASIYAHDVWIPLGRLDPTFHRCSAGLLAHFLRQARLVHSKPGLRVADIWRWKVPEACGL